MTKIVNVDIWVLERDMNWKKEVEESSDNSKDFSMFFFFR